MTTKIPNALLETPGTGGTGGGSSSTGVDGGTPTSNETGTQAVDGGTPTSTP